MTTIEGPRWARGGLNPRAGRFPLSVEAPVQSMVEALAPGVSTTTRFVRYYTLYWAVADYAARQKLNADACNRLVRRAEVVLALTCRHHDPDSEVQPHGLDALNRLDPGPEAVWTVAKKGRRSYSPRDTGFWGQYTGPSLELGTVALDQSAMRPGQHECPVAVREFFRPLLSLASDSSNLPVTTDRLADLAPVRLAHAASPDIAPLRDLFTATRSGRHDPEQWRSADNVRRATLRIIGRAGQLEPETDSWEQSVYAAVAFGPHLREDHVLKDLDQAHAWRGVLLRRLSVGAWRRLWAGLVRQVRELEIATHDDLHQWITAELPDIPTRSFVSALPPVTDAAGDPAPAEGTFQSTTESSYDSEVAWLILGSQRALGLNPLQRAAFLRGRQTFLDPGWIARRVQESLDRRLPEFGRVLVDDMLAQARRVALRKMKVERDGRLMMFTRLHERDGVYTASGEEGFGNVTTRIDQLGGLAEQLGLFTFTTEPITDPGRRLLELP